MRWGRGGEEALVVGRAFELGGEGSGKTSATIKQAAGGTESFKVPFEGADFYMLSWLGFSAMADSRGIVYVDNVMLKVE